MGNLVLGGGSGAPYQIHTSVLNDTDTDWIGYTPSTAGDTKTWSYSCWVKRGKLDGYDTLFQSSSTDGSNDWSALRFEGTTNRIYYYVLENNIVVYSVAWEPNFRDMDHWYHILFVYDTTEADPDDRLKLYIDGELHPVMAGTPPILNYADNPANSNRQSSYVAANGSSCSQGYTAESIFLGDVTATPSDFGEWHPESSDVWRPIDPTAIVNTGGANTFWLKFDKNAVNLGIDSSGNSNNFSLSGLGSNSNGTLDSPTNNFCTLNGSLNNAITVDQDGRSASHTGGSWDTTYGSMAVDSGKWYFETRIATLGARNYHRWGICRYNHDPATYLGYSIDSIGLVNDLSSTLRTLRNGSAITLDASFTDFVVNDVVMVALDLDTKQVWFGKNGTWYGDPVAKTGDAYNGLTGTWMPAISLYGTSAQYMRFGDDSHIYTPPSGFHGWEAKYYEAPPVKDPTDYYQSLTYTGDGTASRYIPFTNSTDLALFKMRTNANPWVVFDSDRGATAELQPDNSGGETVASTGLLSFDTTGVTIGSDVFINQSGQATVAYSWTKSPSAGFDIQTYTGTGAVQTIDHDLGVAPKMMIVKSRSISKSWYVYHPFLGAGEYLILDTGSLSQSSSLIWNNTQPGASSFTVGASTGSNTSGQSHIAYLFADVRGTSKVFNYVGNGDADGTFVHCGFRPQFIMIKSVDLSVDWVLFDDKRDVADEKLLLLEPNQANSEQTLADGGIQITKTGFKLRNAISQMNLSGIDYIGVALASAPTELMNNGAL